MYISYKLSKISLVKYNYIMNYDNELELDCCMDRCTS